MGIDSLDREPNLYSSYRFKGDPEMFSIGTLSDRTGVKVPTIRYYEQIGLIPRPDRSTGNQRRYDRAALDRLAFIRHARDLGFPLDRIADLIALEADPDRPCAEASRIAAERLADVRARLHRLHRLEAELTRIVGQCHGDGTVGACRLMTALADHEGCAGTH